MQNQTVFCRVHSLTSLKGQKLNGRSASFVRSVVTSSPPSSSSRVPVIIDGEKGQLSLKMENLRVFESFEELHVIVNRRYLRSEEYGAKVIDHKRGIAYSSRMISVAGESPITLR
jgi:hypothetical protein